MYGNVKTIWGATLQLSKIINRKHTILQYSTLNEKLGVESGTAVAPNENVDLNYLAIGRGGSLNVGTNDRNLLQHVISDACCFEHIPFVVRDVTNDLDVEERKRFRLRKLITIGGVQKFAYYLMKVDMTTAVPTIVKSTVGQADVPFVSQASQLTPTPVPLDASGKPITSSNTSIIVSAPLEVVLSSEDIANILDACEQIYGSANKAIITEAAFCSGVDRIVTSNAGGINVTYTEAIGVQPFSFLGEDVNLLYTSNSYTFRYILNAVLRLLT